MTHRTGGGEPGSVPPTVEALPPNLEFAAFPVLADG